MNTFDPFEAAAKNNAHTGDSRPANRSSSSIMQLQPLTSSSCNIISIRYLFIRVLLKCLLYDHLCLQQIHENSGPIRRQVSNDLVDYQLLHFQQHHDQRPIICLHKLSMQLYQRQLEQIQRLKHQRFLRLKINSAEFRLTVEEGALLILNLIRIIQKSHILTKSIEFCNFLNFQR